jgi:rRNA maturation endonuclease Nob1
MGYKIVCLNCRTVFNQGMDFDSHHTRNCSGCGKEMILLSHRFRPPKNLLKNIKNKH